MIIEEVNGDIEQLWVKEAVRRDVEIDSGAAMRDAKDVFRDARSRLQKIEMTNKYAEGVR